MARRLILARHPKAAAQQAGRFLGSTDLPLDDDGRAEATAIGRAIGEMSISRALTSPLRRTAETAAILGVDAAIDPDLREVDFGRWEGLSFGEIARADPKLVDRWARFDLDFSFPEGENLGEFVKRTSDVADRLAADSEDTILAVTHGGVIRAMICHLLGLDPKQYLLFEIDPASLTTIDVSTGRGVLVGLNDTCHLKGGV